MYYFLVFLSWSLSLLPYSMLKAKARLLAFLAFDVLRVRRALTLSNLGIAYGDTKTIKEKRKIGRNSYYHFFLTTLEFFVSKNLFPKVEVHEEGEKIFLEALAQGKGVYGLVVHTGNWELLCNYASKHWAPVDVPVKQVGKGETSRWVAERRQENGLTEILAHKNSETSRAVKMFKALRSNHIVAFMADQRRPGGELLSLFGKPALTNVSLPAFFLKHQAPIIPLIISRNKDDSHTIKVFEELTLERREGESVQQFVARCGQLINDRIEDLILYAPEEYFWMHNRWKI